jgi:hypothetical protein
MRSSPTRFLRRLRAELRALLADTTRAWRSGRRPWLAVLGCLTTIAVAGAWHEPRGRDVLAHVGAATAGQPLHTELVRLPASVFIPTFDLPWWGAAAQIAVVLGIAEIVGGRAGMTIVAGIAQFASTLAARLMILSGGVAYLGLPFSQAGVLDTGPSGVTTAIGVWLLCRRRAYASVSVLAAGLTIAALVQRNIDGREHETAMLAGILLALVQNQATRWWHARRATTVEDDGAPARTSSAGSKRFSHPHA